MEWYYALLILVGLLVILLTIGVHVGWSFLIVCLVGAYVWWGGEKGFNQLVLSVATSLSSFNLLAIPLFVMMGEVMFQSGLGIGMIKAVDSWMGRVPGRLALLAVAAGTLFAVMSGSSAASVALLGSVITPEMDKRGYHKDMCTGPIIGSGCLATLIPPSGLAVLLACIANVSIGKTLMAIIIPGLLLAAIFTIYIVVICKVKPSLAPVYHVENISMRQKLISTSRYILPLAFVILAVLGSVFLGIATPTEAAALGTLACIILAAIDKKLTWNLINKSLTEAVIITAMYFMIISAGTAYGQIMAMSQVSNGIFNILMHLSNNPLILILCIHIVLIIIGMFMSIIPALMIAVPIFMPVITTMGYDPIWFVVTLLLNVEVSAISPPYGMGLFVMKSVAPSHFTMQDVYKGGMPFFGLTVFCLTILICFPVISQWLPNLMRSGG